jgi:hypothetical protein
MVIIREFVKFAALHDAEPTVCRGFPNCLEGRVQYNTTPSTFVGHPLLCFGLSTPLPGVVVRSVIVANTGLSGETQR